MYAPGFIEASFFRRLGGAKEGAGPDLGKLSADGRVPPREQVCRWSGMLGQQTPKMECTRWQEKAGIRYNICLGEMAERTKAPVSKTGIPVRVSWVRIPLSPPNIVPTTS